jgi:hypothetical protein
MVALGLGLAPVGAPAQSGIGIKGGLSYGNVANTGVLPGNLDGRTGFAVGVSAGTWGLLGLGAEALFAQRGFTGPNGGDRRELENLDVPAYLRVTLPMPGVAPFAYAGPQVSFELQCRFDDAPCTNPNRPRTSYAATVGGGVKVGGPRSLSIEGRYIYGLTDLKLSTLTDPGNYKTRSFLILAGVGF